MIEEIKYCSDGMKKHFNKELAIIKKGDKDFENLDLWYVHFDHDVKVRDYRHITKKYRDSAHGYCNIKVKLNHKNHIVSCNLKNYDSHIILQELDKFDFKIKFTLKGKLIFIDSFQFLNSSVNSLVKNLSKNGFKYLSPEFVNNVLDLVKQRRFYP